MADTRDAALGTNLNRVWLGALSLCAVVTVFASVAFVWPNRPHVRMIDAGRAQYLRAYFFENGEPLHQEGRFYVVPDGRSADGVKVVEPRGGHPRELISYCPSSRLFEGSLGSRFTLGGDVLPGSPSPRGLDSRPVTVTPGGDVLVDMTTRARGLFFSDRRVPPHAPAGFVRHCGS